MKSLVSDESEDGAFENDSSLTNRERLLNMMDEGFKMMDEVFRGRDDGPVSAGTIL